jgi:predicted nucleic acid-binding protein
MSVLVVDASVIAPAIADGGPDGDVCRARLKNQALVAPDLLRVEVLSVIRRHAANGALTKRQADNAVDDLLNLPIVVYPTTPLLRRSWELPGNVTAYDACYVTLAEALGCTLLTADSRLANAPGTRCQFDIV